MSMPAPQRLSPSDLLREWRLLRDLAALAGDRRIDDLPRGDGAPVMVIPGFGATDGATSVLRRRLRRLNYQVSGWTLGRNHGRVEADLERLLPVYDQFQAHTGRGITLIGWSLGGVIPRELARLRPATTHRIITLGSPLAGGPKYTFTASWYARQGLDLDRIERKVAEREAKTPLPCPLLSLYTPRDGMVHFGASFDPWHPEVRHREVDSSHLGMCLSPDVLRVIAHELAPTP